MSVEQARIKDDTQNFEYDKSPILIFMLTQIFSLPGFPFLALKSIPRLVWSDQTDFVRKTAVFPTWYGLAKMDLCKRARIQLGEYRLSYPVAGARKRIGIE